jgi:hypothetical protein
VERVFGPLPFARLSRAHALLVGADACITVSLAGSLFFSASIDAARPQLTLYLLFTLAPFALVVPLVGPAVDRFAGAQPSFLSFTGQARAILALFIAADLENLLLYPESFAVLVLGKAYSIAKSSTVPGLVDPDDLVLANSRLARIGAVSAAAAGGVATVVQGIGDPTWTLRLAAILHLGGAALALRIPRRELAVAAHADAGDLDKSTMRPAGVWMALLRAAVGFTTFALAFSLKRAGAPLALFGVVALGGALGHFVGTLVSPLVRRRVIHDELILAAALFVGAVGLALAVVQFGSSGKVLASFAVTLAASVGRQAFDAALQRRAPLGARGRSFARYETTFQLVWVAGALIPVAIDIDARAGLVVLAAVLGAGAVVALVRDVGARATRAA